MICEKRAAGAPFRRIVKECRAEHHKINLPDLTRWRQDKEPITIDGKEVTFDEMFEWAEASRADDLERQVIEIADDGDEDNAKIIGHRMKARMWAADNMRAQRVELSGEVKGTAGVTVQLVERDPSP